MRGTGGLPGPRVDQQRRPSAGSGTTPGSAAGVVLARQVIVYGTSEGVFVYNGKPALGNPPIAWTASGALDPFGNVLPTSQASIGVSGLNGAYIALLPSTSVAAVPQIIMVPGGATQLGSPPDIFSAIAGAGTTAERYAINLLTGYSTAGTAYQSGIYFSGAAGDGSADGFMFLNVAAASGSPVSAFSITPEQIIAGAPIAGQRPGAGTGTADSWNTMSLINGWGAGGSGFAQYKAYPDNTIGVRFAGLTPGTTTDGTEIWAPPTGYVPQFAGTQSFPVVANYSTAPASPTSVPQVVFKTSGGMECFNLRGTVASIAGSFRYPLD